MKNTPQEQDQITESIFAGELVLASQKIDPINSVCAMRRDWGDGFIYLLRWFHHESRLFYWEREFGSKKGLMTAMKETMEKGSYSAPE